MEETRKIRMFKEWWEAYRWGVKINPKRYAWMLFCTLVGATVPFLSANVMAEIIQFVTQYYAFSTLEYGHLAIAGGCALATILARLCAINANFVVYRRLDLEIRRAVNDRSLRAAARLSVPKLELGSTKDLIDKIDNNAANSYVEIILRSRNIFDETTRMAIAAFVLFSYSPLIFAILLVNGTMNVFFNLRFNKAFEDMEQKILQPERRSGQAYGRPLIDSDMAKEVKLFGLQDYLRNSYLRYFQIASVQREILIKRFRTPLMGLEGLNNLLVGVGVLGILVMQAIEKTISIGQMTLGFSQASTFDGSLDRVSSLLPDQAMSAYRVSNLTQLEALAENDEDAGTLPEKKTHEVRFENVGFYYDVEIDGAGSSGVSQYAEGDDVHNGEVSDGKRWVFRHLNLTFEAGKHYALVGQNGAGKTTLIKLLVGFYKPQEGRILVDGIDLRELNQAAWHRELGVLFQDFNNYQISARENIGFGNLEEHADDAKVRAAAKRSGADIVIEALPGGYDQKLGKWQKGGMNLSGGQWQKVALARAFMRDARFIVLDEPTAAIDAIAEEEIFNEIYREGSDKTIVLISHRFSTVRRADEIIVLEQGKLEEQGTHEDLIAKQGRYHEMFTLQAKAYQA